MVFIVLFLAVAFGFSAIAIALIYEERSRIEDKYISDDIRYYLTDKETGEQIGDGVRIGTGRTTYSIKDRDTLHRLETLSMFMIPFFIVTSIIGTAFLFYHIKLKKPLLELEKASSKISMNNLDFKISYENRDEMGRLCSSFELMRKALLENNQEMWRQMEERKRLNAAFSHDLRTPLTVLKGHTDMMLKYIPQGEMSQEKLLETVATLSNQISRLENYTEAMNGLQRLEDIQIVRKELPFADFVSSLNSTADILCMGKQVNVITGGVYRYINIDIEIAMQVCENVISNAMRYATDCININVNLIEEKLTIAVADDGSGFSKEDLEKATHPFYRANKDNYNSITNPHFGLGLNICKILTKRHGGDIVLDNNDSGSAVVTVSFSQE